MYTFSKNKFHHSSVSPTRTTRQYFVLIVVGLLCPLWAQANTPQCQTHEQSRLKVTYFVPDKLGHGFWKMQLDFMRAVAEDLGIELNFEKLGDEQQNRFYFGDLVKNRLKHKSVDYVMGPLFRKGEINLLNTIEKLKLPFVSTNTSISPERFKVLGLPRDKYKYWLANFAPDNITAGAALTEYMLKLKAQQQPKAKRRINIAAINGTQVSVVSHHRAQGLKQAVLQHKATLLPIFHTDWSQSSAFTAMRTLLRRKLPLDIVWTVGSDSAMGVVNAMLEQNITPGRGVLVGTMDWSPEAVELLDKDYIKVSFGGHFMEGGWVLLLLFDHAKGFDFSNQLGTNIVTKLRALTQDNLSFYRQAILEQNWSAFDFKQLSRCYNPKLASYQFDMDILRHQ